MWKRKAQRIALPALILAALAVGLAGCNIFNNSIDEFLDRKGDKGYYGPVSFTSVEALASWLGSRRMNYPNGPSYKIKLTVPLSGSDPLAAMNAVQDGRILLIDLDLSGCSGITTWGSGLINRAGLVTRLVLPDSVRILEEGALSDYSSVTELKGTGVMRISGSIFNSFNAEQSQLQSASFPALARLGQDAFKNRSTLTDLYLGATPPTLVGDNFFSGTAGGTSPGITIHVPGGSATVNTYLGAGWNSCGVNENPSIYGDDHNNIQIVSP